MSPLEEVKARSPRTSAQTSAPNLRPESTPNPGAPWPTFRLFLFNVRWCKLYIYIYFIFMYIHMIYCVNHWYSKILNMVIHGHLCVLQSFYHMFESSSHSSLVSPVPAPTHPRPRELGSRAPRWFSSLGPGNLCPQRWAWPEKPWFVRVTPAGDARLIFWRIRYTIYYTWIECDIIFNM